MANYDKRPLALEPKGNGSFFYRWNIEEVEGDFSSWNCDEVTIWNPVTRDAIKKKVIEYLWGGDHEKKLINEYNSVSLGIISGDKAIAVEASYKAFLAKRIEIKNIVNNDCDKFNIK